MNENTEAERDFLLHPADRATLRRHAKMRIFVEADRLTAMKDGQDAESRQAVGYLTIMGNILHAVGWPEEDPRARATGLLLDERFVEEGQLRAWVEQHFLPEDKATLADAEGDPSLNLGRALSNLGDTLSLHMRLRQRLAERHGTVDDPIVKAAADLMVGETALELARNAKRMMDEAEKAVGLSGDRADVLRSIGGDPAELGSAA